MPFNPTIHYPLMILALLVFAPGCTAIPATSPGEPLLSTQTNAPSITPANTPKPTITRIPSKTPPATPTSVPIGIFALKFYPPLVMDYDPSLWEDKSEYTNPDWMINYLQSRSIASCMIGVQGPTDFNGPTPQFVSVQLGEIRYSVTTFTDATRGEVSAMYIEEQSLSNYDYAPGLPIPVIFASTSEWDACKDLAEEVLATLHSPPD